MTRGHGAWEWKCCCRVCVCVRPKAQSVRLKVCDDPTLPERVVPPGIGLWRTLSTAEEGGPGQRSARGARSHPWTTHEESMEAGDLHPREETAGLHAHAGIVVCVGDLFLLCVWNAENEV